MRVGTYPTRDFATLGNLLLIQLLHSLPPLLKGKVRMGQSDGANHFCRPLHVAIQIGPYLPHVPTGVWRMVSEDSREVRAAPWTWLDSSSPRSFLLIVRTGRIITGRPRLDRLSSAGYSEFPAYSQIL